MAIIKIANCWRMHKTKSEARGKTAERRPVECLQFNGDDLDRRSLDIDAENRGVGTHLALPSFLPASFHSYHADLSRLEARKQASIEVNDKARSL